MQHRMKTHALTINQVEELFDRAQVGRIATQNQDGFPYAVPVHFVYYQGKIYVHGLPKGQKIDNIKKNSKVCFEIDEMITLICDGVSVACDINTKFNSVIALGHARVIKEVIYVKEVLDKIIEKYTPHLSGSIIPENMLKGTAVIEISISECTGKYYQ